MVIGVVVCIVMYLMMLFVVGGDVNDILGDGVDLYYQVSVVVLDYGDGLIDWGKLIDDAWFVVVGLVYYYIYLSLFVIVVLNGFVVGLVLVLLFCIVMMVTSNWLVVLVVSFMVVLFFLVVFF